MNYESDNFCGEYYELKYLYNILKTENEKLKDENLQLKTQNNDLSEQLKDIQTPKWGWKSGEEIVRELIRN